MTIMKAIATLLMTYVGVVNSLQCRPTLDEEFNILVTELKSYDIFIFGRYLRTERATCEKAEQAIQQLQSSFAAEMGWPMNQALTQLMSVRELVAGTQAEGCVNGLQLFHDQINEEQAKFEQCVETPKFKQQYLFQKLDEDTKSYQEEQTNAGRALLNCFSNFPSKCPNALREACTRSQMNIFMNRSRSLTESLNTESPCMQNFQLVLHCLDNSVRNLQKRGEEFLNNLYDECARLVQGQELQASITAFRKPFNFNSTLLEQVKNAQERYLDENKQILGTLSEFYRKEKTARYTYEFRPHSQEHFYSMWSQELAPYKESVDRAVQNNEFVFQREASECLPPAYEDLELLASSGASTSVKCEENILRDTLEHIKRIRETLYKTTKRFSLLGNPAVLDCFINEDYIFRANAIESCYDIKHRYFDLFKGKNMEIIEEKMRTLERLNRTYFALPDNRFPCGDGEPQKRGVVFLDADYVLDELEKCLYRTSGTVYEISPVMPSPTAPPSTSAPLIPTTSARDWPTHLPVEVSTMSSRTPLEPATPTTSPPGK